MTLLYLFLEFFKTGLFAVGGGLATIPFLKDIAERYSWFDSSEITDMIAISEATPGPIGVNMATYAGYQAGLDSTQNVWLSFLYGAFTTISLIVPSIIVILIVSKMLEKFKSNKIVEYAFYGIRPASAALITAAMLDVFVMSITKVDIISIICGKLESFSMNWIALAMFCVFVVLVVKLKKVHPIVFIAVGAVLGIALKL